MKSVMGGVTTYYVDNTIEWPGSASTMVKYYYAGGQRIAMRAGSAAPLFLLGDHLGSTSKTYHTANGATTEQRYTPWGETRYGSSPTSYQYTGQRKDATGLYFYHARYYDPALGRFTQADSIVPGAADGAGGGAATLGYDSRTRLTPLTVNLGEFAAQVNAESREVLQFEAFFQWDSNVRQEHNVPMGPANPQALNRYAYCLNNPLRYTDPTGHIYFLPPLVTGGLGALASAGGSFIAQVTLGEGSVTERIQGVDWGNVAIAGGVGFVAGALAPFVPSALGAIALAADANVAQYVLTQKSNDDPITNGGVIANLGSGMLAGAIAGPLTQPAGKLLYGAGYQFTAGEVARENADIMIQYSVLAGENVGRSILGGVASNWDWPKQITDAFNWVVEPLVDGR